MKRVLFLSIVCLFSVLSIPMLAKAGVTDVLPRNMELMPSESERMMFQIQSIANPKNLTCIYQILHKSCLEMKFDEQETIVPAGGRKDVWGTVTAPANVTACPYGNYTEEFFVSCGLYNPSGGYAVRQDVAGMKMSINVVESHNPKYKPMYPVQPAPPNYTIYYMIIGLVIAVIAVFVVAYLIYRWKKSPKTSSPPTDNLSTSEQNKDI